MVQWMMKMTFLQVPHCLMFYFDPKPDLIYKDEVLLSAESYHAFNTIKHCCEHHG
jgi:hypothetical protein